MVLVFCVLYCIRYQKYKVHLQRSLQCMILHFSIGADNISTCQDWIDWDHADANATVEKSVRRTIYNEELFVFEGQSVSICSVPSLGVGGQFATRDQAGGGLICYVDLKPNFTFES